MPLAGQAAEPAHDVNELMRRVDELWRGDSSYARMTMRVKTRRYERAMEMEAWSKGKERSLVKILAPKKDEGIATLKVDKNIWNYLPKINRVTKIPSSMMGGSWMGSHFTNDDLVKESYYEEDYTSALTFTGTRDGQALYEVTSTPKPNAPVVWGKVVTIISQGQLLPLRSIYYDEQNQPVREMVFDEVRDFSGKRIPARLTLLPLDKPSESTTILYEALELDVPINENQFSLRALSRR